MTKPETLPALIDRIERVRDWALRKQGEPVMPRGSGDRARGAAELEAVIAKRQYAAIEEAMKILLGEHSESRFGANPPS